MTVRGFSTTLLDKAAVRRIRDCHPLMNNRVGATASQITLHWTFVKQGSVWGPVDPLGTTTPPLLSQWCPKSGQRATEVWDGSSSLTQPPPSHALCWLKMYQHATPKQYNCSITAPSAETSYIGLMFYDIGGSTLHIVYLPSTTDPRQGFSKLQPCYQGCHAAQQRQNYCFLPHIIATCSVAECSHMQWDIPIPGLG